MLEAVRGYGAFVLFAALVSYCWWTGIVPWYSITAFAVLLLAYILVALRRAFLLARNRG